MTDVEKGMIIGLFYAYGVVSMVAKIVKQPWSTVESLLDRTWIRGGNKENLLHSERPVKLNCYGTA